MNAAELYDRDFAEWAVRNAELLRSGRVAEADVHRVFQRRDERGHDLLAPLDRGGHEGRFFSDAPVVVTERREQELGPLASFDLRDLLDRDPARFGLGLLEQPTDRG